MNNRAEVDIITHLAVCASQDWNKVGRIVVGDFVTASQVQRKWYTRVLEKLSGGGYGLGAVCVFFLLVFFPPLHACG
jgi:phosphatidylserine decarboxylase